ncbi:unnamed protein product [Caenorhabditis auriculariae]|uniref:ZP domain-containing protein n=1 Tax=Caenorhabditis auriculariae TaxID=2777116 RepID=A0A8S1HVG2_9PELO|nr:unnamed protein product [Caenorhabditis auriculariae]
MTVKIPMLNSTQCGVQTNQTSGAYSVKLIVSPVEGLIVDGFTAVSVRCLYSTQDITLTLPPGPNGTSGLQILGNQQNDESVVTGTGGSPSLTMQILDGHGVDGAPLSRAAVGQRITLDIVLKNTAIYDFYVHSCYAHDGSNTPDASINIIDSNGCGVRLSRAVDVPVLSNQPTGVSDAKHVFLYMYGFQFTSNNFVHFECQVRPCVHSCHRQQCEPDDEAEKVPLIPALRKRRDERKLATLHLQTVLEIEPQSASKAALVWEGPDPESSCLSATSLGFAAVLLCLSTASIVCLLHSKRRYFCFS